MCIVCDIEKAVDDQLKSGVFVKVPESMSASEIHAVTQAIIETPINDPAYATFAAILQENPIFEIHSVASEAFAYWLLSTKQYDNLRAAAIAYDAVRELRSLLKHDHKTPDPLVNIHAILHDRILELLYKSRQ